jgi:hypothetical protein
VRQLPTMKSALFNLEPTCPNNVFSFPFGESPEGEIHCRQRDVRASTASKHPK